MENICVKGLKETHNTEMEIETWRLKAVEPYGMKIDGTWHNL